MLTSYNGTKITYDAIGNPLSYRGATMTWQNGRQLASWQDSSDAVSYTYNADGIRTSKTINGQTTDFTLDGTKIIRSQKDSVIIYYYYDESGSPIGMTLNGVNYYYIKNAQGDVVRICDESGNIVITYNYDAWGNLVNFSGSVVLFLANPFRYRGYYYDLETGFYYLNSRYYDPAVGRFINADSVVAGVGGDIRGYNLFAYCFNNPVNMNDPTGCWPTWGQVFGVVAGVAIAAVGVAAVVVAAPVILPALAVGAVTTAAVAAGTVACGAVAVVCGASIAGEAVTGKNPVRDLVGQENFDAITMISTMGAIQGTEALVNAGVAGNSPGKSSTISRGSTAVKQPSNLTEKLALEQVKSNPQGIKIPVQMTDPRWPASEGWVKMQQIVPTSQGNINIHYVYNQNIKIFDDFKIK